MSLMLQSVVTRTPMVEWSEMTFFVPNSAACSNGIGAGDHGVITIRGAPSSM